ncbi:hypothetical protein Acr_11g0008480 [Actinidia rufa]|uniref:Uncharacterized protein n=1 Tax=Actinidia rufa TaxID=165716 RepID=A0A7J0FCY2_9ERIC|nr:hypothetical protein Acr_11g0008480 [Actinidia rufa]
MGSCISKCKGKRMHNEEPNHIVQDKLVISQAPISPLPLSPTKHPLSPQSTNSISSISSFSCTASNNTGLCSLTSSMSSSSSSSSSVSSSLMFISSKEKSFSNEYLWSCVKENPQIIHIDHPTKGKNSTLQMPKNVHAQKLRLGSFEPSPSRHVGSNKRVRVNSPTLSRQKSFRREQERPNSVNSEPNRTLRWPSPSRRFGGENNNSRGGLKNAHKENVVGSGSLYVRKENFRPSSPGNNLSRNRPCLTKRESRIYNVGFKIDEIAAGEAVSNHDDDAIPMEDIDNPLIALDCFIFL